MNVSSLAFIAAGGNEHPSAADVDDTGIVAFGAGQNIALWRPNCGRGILALLSGHTGTVNAIKFWRSDSPDCTIISGSADSTVRIWEAKQGQFDSFVCNGILEAHTKSINAIAVLPGLRLFVTGAADSTVKIWSILTDGTPHAKPVQTISTPLIPLTLAAAQLPDSEASIIAVGGSKSIVQVYASKSAHAGFSLAATLSGHEGWIRALDFVELDNFVTDSKDLLLASASQDKYIRLWRFSLDQKGPTHNGEAKNNSLASSHVLGGLMSNKAHRFDTSNGIYAINFDALLLGHEDWVYSTRWIAQGGSLRLLSASADNSLAIWEPEESSGVWTCTVRLGEISAQKGATTATGSAGGFWLGLWYNHGHSVLSLGKSGSWRKWIRDETRDEWIQDVAVGGHTRAVNGISWSKDGSYLLSTSSDKTTRLFAPSAAESVWHEFSRPQIHGYELNCIDAISETKFISGADEKLLRVFEEPRAVAQRLYEACGIGSKEDGQLLEAANMPVLGLSNKAIEADEVEPTPTNDAYERSSNSIGGSSGGESGLSQAPIEDQLARNLLWPETEKLYGHGYEICSVAVSQDGSMVATACRASSVTHAAIRIYRTDNWQMSQPPLEAHSLTVTRLRFSPNDRYLLSVSRDRQCAIFERTDKTYNLLPATLHKAHSRMILDATWLPGAISFATAGRDKAVRIWRGERTENEIKLQSIHTLNANLPVTAIDCHFTAVVGGKMFNLAYALEDGSLFTCSFSADTLLPAREPVQIAHAIAPSKSVTQIAWRSQRPGGQIMLAVASEDCSVRILRLCS